MNRLLYSIISLLLAGCIWLFLENRDMVEMYKAFNDKSSALEVYTSKQEEALEIMEQKIEKLRDSVTVLTFENADLKNNPVVVTKTIIKKNEKVIPISNAASEYYNSILAKRYQDK